MVFLPTSPNPPSAKNSDFAGFQQRVFIYLTERKIILYTII